MAWTSVATVVTGDIITASWGNTYVRDNTQFLYDDKISIPANSAQGDVLYRNASAWTRLAAGTAGQKLRTGGASANPSWATDVLVPDTARRYVVQMGTSATGYQTGSGVGSANGNFNTVATGTTPGSMCYSASITVSGSGAIADFYDVNPAFSVLAYRGAGSSSTQRQMFLATGVIVTSGTVTSEGFGFRLEGDTLYAWNADGATETKTDISSGITLAAYNHYHAKMISGTRIEFYVNGTLKATHTTNLPAGSEEKLCGIRVQNGTDAANHQWFTGPFLVSF